MALPLIGTRRPLVVGNWKMNGDKAFNASLIAAMKNASSDVSTEMVVCPPLPYLAACADLLAGSSIKLGAQNCAHFAGPGAHTGEVAASMLAEIGCQYVIVGHSERRAHQDEADWQVALKTETVLNAGLTPIICVGESAQHRELGVHRIVVIEQLAAVVEHIGTRIADTVVAYEPVWAVGSGKTATPEQAQEIHSILRHKIRKVIGECADTIRLLYGGSVKPENASNLFAQPDIDGGLLGGAALKADDFLAICRIAQS